MFQGISPSGRSRKLRSCSGRSRCPPFRRHSAKPLLEPALVDSGCASFGSCACSASSFAAAPGGAGGLKPLLRQCERVLGRTPACKLGLQVFLVGTMRHRSCMHSCHRLGPLLDCLVVLGRKSCDGLVGAETGILPRNAGCCADTPLTGGVAKGSCGVQLVCCLAGLRVRFTFLRACRLFDPLNPRLRVGREAL